MQYEYDQSVVPSADEMSAILHKAKTYAWNKFQVAAEPSVKNERRAIYIRCCEVYKMHLESIGIDSGRARDTYERQLGLL